MDLEKVDLLTDIDSLRRGWQACEARLAAVEGERDAAKAGEARVMEVIQKLLKSAVPNRRDHPTMWDAWTFAETFIENEQPALDWLAQREREAAAKALEKAALKGWATPFSLREDAAALRAGKEGE